MRWARTGLPPAQVYEAEDVGDPVRGCFTSHLNVLAAHTGPVAIFEDDALFAPTFTLDVQPPEDADVLWLGGQHLVRPDHVSDGWVRPRRMARTHAYIANDPQKLLEHLPLWPRRHYDAALTHAGVPQLALSPFTVGQSAGVSSISGINYLNHRFWND